MHFIQESLFSIIFWEHKPVSSYVGDLGKSGPCSCKISLYETMTVEVCSWTGLPRQNTVCVLITHRLKGTFELPLYGGEEKNQFCLKLMDFLILPGVSDTQEILHSTGYSYLGIFEILVFSCGSFFMGFLWGFVFF